MNNNSDINRAHLYWAGSAENQRPKEAICLYIQGVESLITARSLGNYDQAAIHLQIVPGLFERLGKSQSWDNLITDHRERNHRLPALQDELNKPGL